MYQIPHHPEKHHSGLSILSAWPFPCTQPQCLSVRRKKNAHTHTHTQSPQQVTREKGNSASSCFRVSSLWAAAHKGMRHLKLMLVVCNHRGTLASDGHLSLCKDQLLDLHVWSVSLETGSETQLSNWQYLHEWWPTNCTHNLVLMALILF